VSGKGFRDPAVELDWASRLGGKVAFLRHRIPWLEHRESSDWDLAVCDLETTVEVTESVLGKPLLTVSRVYVEQRYYRWGQIDFLPSFEWNGYVYLDPERFWSRVATGDDGLPRPCLAHDALIAWLTGLLTGGVYQPRYDRLLQEAWAVDGRELRDSLRWAFGEDLAAEMVFLLERKNPGEAVLLVSDLRSALKWRSVLRSPAEVVERVLRHWWCELQHHWKPPFPWLAFLGPDGVGKSTVIEAVEEFLKPSRLKILLVHWRPKLAGREAADAKVVTDPHGRSPRGFLASSLALALLWVRWMIGRFGRTWHQRAKQKIMVSDRYYPDLLVDPRRYRYRGSLSLARWVFRTLPKPDLTIVLLADPEVILARKEEVSRKELTRQLSVYRALADELPNDVVTLDAGRSVSEVREEVARILLERVFRVS
jgi:thymidylate kinase